MQEDVWHRVRVALKIRPIMETSWIDDWIDDLMLAVDRAVPRLFEIKDAAAGGRPAPGRWSPKEIIGHLIDPAVNNQAWYVAHLQHHLRQVLG